MFSRLPIKSFRTLFLQRAFSSNEMTVKNPKNHQKNLPQKNKDKEQEKINFDYLYGVNPVMSAIYSDRRTLHELFVIETVQEENYRIQNIVNRANSLKLPVKYIQKEKLERFAKNQPHQGIVLKCEPLSYLRISSPKHLLLQNRQTGLVWILIDQVTDPQNFGAMIRSATFLGVDGVLVTEKNMCPLTPTVSKTSAGALELFEINCVQNPETFIKECAKSGWRVVVTALDKESSKSKEISELKLEPNENVLLILGSEHSGVSKPLIQNSTDIAYIGSGLSPELNKFPYTLLDSLNVSVSCGIAVKLIKEKLKQS